MANDQNPFTAGVVAMRAKAVEKAASWHEAKWVSQTTISADDVHDIINCICEDIRTATVQPQEVSHG